VIATAVHGHHSPDAVVLQQAYALKQLNTTCIYAIEFMSLSVIAVNANFGGQQQEAREGRRLPDKMGPPTT